MAGFAIRTRGVCALAAVALMLALPAGAGASTHAGAALDAVIARLDRDRVHDRAALQRARSRSEQARLARHLALVHSAAADAVRPEAAALGAQLSEAAGAYSALARAATGESATRYAAAADAVGRTDARLAAAVKATGRPSAIRPVAPAAAPSSGSSTMIMVALALLAAVSGGAWRLRRRTRHAAPVAGPAARARGPWRPKTRPTSLRPQPPAPQPPARAGSDAARRWDGGAPPEPDPRADTQGAALPA